MSSKQEKPEQKKKIHPLLVESDDKRLLKDRGHEKGTYVRRNVAIQPPSGSISNSQRELKFLVATYTHLDPKKIEAFVAGIFKIVPPKKPMQVIDFEERVRILADRQNTTESIENPDDPFSDPELEVVSLFKQVAEHKPIPYDRDAVSEFCVAVSKVMVGAGNFDPDHYKVSMT
jgi:hypothetical protein